MTKTHNEIKANQRILTLPLSKREFIDRAVYIILIIAILMIIIPFFVIISDVLIRGIPGLSVTFIYQTAMGGGIRNAIVGTLYLVVIATLVAIPLSVGAAVYITEYAKPGIIRQVVEFTADVLAGVPSIVFGAFGYLFFTAILGLGQSLISGALTLSLMMIPTVLRTTQESLRAVPLSLREASLALGATRWSTTWRVTLRACFPAIVTGGLLAIIRVAGETAPLLFTTGSNVDLPWSIFDAVASLPLTIYLYAKHYDPILNQQAYSAAIVLILGVLFVDLIANYLSRKVGILVSKE